MNCCSRSAPQRWLFRDSQTRSVEWYNRNYRAQTAAALRLLNSVEALGERATPADVGMLVKVLASSCCLAIIFCCHV